MLDVEGMAKAFLDEVDPFGENNDSYEDESLLKDINSDGSVKTSTPKLGKIPVAEPVKPSKLNNSDVKSTKRTTGSSGFEAADSVKKTVDASAAISITKGADATTPKAIKSTSLNPAITKSNATEFTTVESMSAKSKNEEEEEEEEEADIKPKKRFTKPDQLADAGPALTKRQRKKLEQKMLLKESIRVREETQFVSGLGHRRLHEAGKEEKYDSATSSLVSTPSIPEPEIVRSSIPELSKVLSKDVPMEISKPKKTNKKFKKLDLNDLDTMDNASPEKSEPAWANEKPGVYSVADEVAKISNESSKPKPVSKKVDALKISSTPSPVNVSPKEESVSPVKKTAKVPDTKLDTTVKSDTTVKPDTKVKSDTKTKSDTKVKPETKAKPVPTLISRDTPTDVVKEVIEQASSHSSEEKEKSYLNAPAQIASPKVSEKKASSEKPKTKEVKPVLKEAKSSSPVTTDAPLSKKTKSPKQKKEPVTGEPVRSTESAIVDEAELDLDENDELIDTIVDPEFIEDLVNKTLESTSSTLVSLFDASPQFITQDSPTFSSSEFESYTPDTDITAEELSLDALCKLLTPHIEIKGDVSLEQAEECLRQSKKMLEGLETSFVNTVKEATTVCKTVNKAGKK